MPIVRSAALLVIVVLLGAVGCPEHKAKPTQPKLCTKSFEQCTLADGTLGVCQPIECQAGKAPPCMYCMDQH
jgi:hypothetical protein